MRNVAFAIWMAGFAAASNMHYDSTHGLTFGGIVDVVVWIVIGAALWEGRKKSEPT